VCDYVHLNPVRAKLLGKGQKLRRIAGAVTGYLKSPRAGELAAVDRLLGEDGIPKDSAAGARNLSGDGVAAMGRSAGAMEGSAAGWCLGMKRFVRSYWRRWLRRREPRIMGMNCGIGAGKGATDRGRGNEEAGWLKRSGAESERGPAEGANSAAAAAGDDNDIEMDSRSVKDGTWTHVATGYTT